LTAEASKREDLGAGPARRLRRSVVFVKEIDWQWGRGPRKGRALFSTGAGKSGRLHRLYKQARRSRAGERGPSMPKPMGVARKIGRFGAVGLHFERRSLDALPRCGGKVRSSRRGPSGVTGRLFHGAFDNPGALPSKHFYRGLVGAWLRQAIACAGSDGADGVPPEGYNFVWRGFRDRVRNSGPSKAKKDNQNKYLGARTNGGTGGYNAFVSAMCRDTPAKGGFGRFPDKTISRWMMGGRTPRAGTQKAVLSGTSARRG